MPAGPLAALLALSRHLANSRQGGVLSNAVDLLRPAIPGGRLAIWQVVTDRLTLLAEHGIPADLRGDLAFLAMAEPHWFGVQRAARKRRVVTDADVAASSAGRLTSDELTKGGWSALVAVPIVIGRDVYGVLAAGHTDARRLGGETTEFLEAAANLLALGMLGAASTEDRRDAGRVVKTAEMAALGMLAAGVADELRGPLGALAMLLESQQRVVVDLGRRYEVAEAAELAELTDEAIAAVARARGITGRLLSAVHEATPERLDVGTLVRGVLERLGSYLAARSVSLEVRIGEECCVSGRREALAQMLANLVMNAADACEEQDRARGGVGHAAGRRVRVIVSQASARVVIAVEDSGPGVAANLRARIFDPFFTTKPDAIGIGLTLARQAVVAHAGHIELTGSSFGGTLFRVVLPAAEAVAREASTHPPRTPLAVAVAQAAGPSTAAPAARARILWIDDDEVFLRGVKRMLGDWDIHTAFTAKEAEELLARESGAALVFCDVGLPDGSGHLVHARVRETDEGLASRFVFVTGGVITPEVADYLIASGCPTLLKPVRAEEIRALLEGSEDDDAPTSARTLRDAASGPPPGPTPKAPTVQPRPDAPTVQPRPDAPTVRGAGGARGADGAGQQRAAVTVPQRQIGRGLDPATDAPTRREREITDARAEAEQTAPVRRPDDTSPDGRGRRR